MAGADALVAALNRLAEQLPKAGERVVVRSQVLMEAATKKQFRQAHKRGTKTPSAPGTPPAVVTGSMRRGVISDTPQHLSAGVVQGRVFPTTVYSRIQELGGTTGRNHATHLPARPSMRPAQLSITSQVRAIQREEFARIMPRG